MGLLEPITHKEEIEKLVSEAQDMYDTAKRNFEAQKRMTTKSLRNLGKIKIKSWSQGMDRFVVAFNSFANISVDKRLDTNMSFAGSDIEPASMLMNIQNATFTAGEVAKAGFAAVGTGALVGVASYGGAMMFGSASTGTAIATLSGAAKTNATLAWFGGGAKAVGGLGMAGGKLVLAGIVALPILAVGGFIAGVKGKERLAEAKKIYAEAEDATEKLNIMTSAMSGIAAMSENYSKFIKKFDRKFQPFIREIEKIKNKYSSISFEKIDFNILTVSEQKTIHLTWLMAQIYYSVLSTPILTDQGVVSDESGNILSSATGNMKIIKKDTYKMNGDEAPAANILWRRSANRVLVIGFAVVAILLFVGYMLISSSVFAGLLVMLDSAIALPIFFKFKRLPQSKKYTWRIIRMSVASLIAIVIIILFWMGIL